MTDFLLDTNILILHLRKAPGYEKMLAGLAEEGLLAVSVITRLEVIRGMRDPERRATFQLLNSLESLELSAGIADAAGELILDWRKKGITLADADAVIAATALTHSLALVTTNEKHFPMPELALYQPNREGMLIKKGLDIS